MSARQDVHTGSETHRVSQRLYSQGYTGKPTKREYRLICINYTTSHWMTTVNYEVVNVWKGS
jgi:hypothetical protein